MLKNIGMGKGKESDFNCLLVSRKESTKKPAEITKKPEAIIEQLKS